MADVEHVIETERSMVLSVPPDRLDPMSENRWQNRIGEVAGARAMTLTAFVERAEREQAEDGPTMAEWLEGIRGLDWGTVTTDDLIAEIRGYRDRDKP
ncbi:hypothetical protein FKR81_13540 [Lentzea tibetensis]|uniref:Uncharacterized protein n=1 Tax=Lentzea tibetensis TaxID=2591470 RepID=A0A563EWF8_9PSEU|nr:hypothetical protein [Lentzea tibetensis]TWP51868.1 hypothetical protein FKR81_13540 [Lentzea tibetensis]